MSSGNAVVDAWFSIPSLAVDSEAAWDAFLFATGDQPDADNGELVRAEGTSTLGGATKSGQPVAAQGKQAVTGVSSEKSDEIMAYLYLLYGKDAKLLLEANQLAGNVVTVADVPDWKIPFTGEPPSMLVWVRDGDYYRLVIDNGQSLTPPQMAQELMKQLMASLQHWKVRNQLITLDPMLNDPATIDFYRQGMQAALLNGKQITTTVSKMYTEGFVECLPGGALMLTGYHASNGQWLDAGLTILPLVPDGIGIVKNGVDHLSDLAKYGDINGARKMDPGVLAGAGGRWPVIGEVVDPKVIKQMTDNACGPTCASMLLKDRGILDISPANIAALQKQVASDLRSIIGAMNEATKGTVKWTGNYFNPGDFPKVDGSWMALMYDQASHHLIVVDGLDNLGRVMIRDPQDGTRYLMLYTDFHKYWTGGAAYEVIP